MPTFDEDADESYGLDARSIEAIERVVRRILETDGRKPAERGRWHKFPYCTALAKSGESGIPARDDTTPGFHEVTLYKCDEDEASAVLEALTGDYSTVTAYNLSGTAVAANVYLQLIRIGNKWWVMFEDCS